MNLKKADCVNWRYMKIPGVYLMAGFGIGDAKLLSTRILDEYR